MIAALWRPSLVGCHSWRYCIWDWRRSKGCGSRTLLTVIVIIATSHLPRSCILSVTLTDYLCYSTCCSLNKCLQLFVVHVEWPQWLLLHLAWLSEVHLHKGLVISLQFTLHTSFHSLEVVHGQRLQWLPSIGPLLRVTSNHKSLSCLLEKLLSVSCNPAVRGGRISCLCCDTFVQSGIAGGPV